MSKQYVQHVSGQGEKWELVSGVESGNNWRVYADDKQDWHNCHWVPKSEYRLCEPPERWVDVTEQIQVQWGEIVLPMQGPIGPSYLCIQKRDDYRLRKVQLWQTHGQGDTPNCPMAAFVVEKKVCE